MCTLYSNCMIDGINKRDKGLVGELINIKIEMSSVCMPNKYKLPVDGKQL